MASSRSASNTTYLVSGTTDDDAAAIVHRYYALVDSGDLALIDLFERNATYKRPGYTELRGRDELLAFYTSERMIETGEHTLHTLFVDGLQAAVEGRGWSSGRR